MNMEDAEFKKVLIKKLDELSTRIDALIQVVAITSRREIIAKGKTKTDQIVTLHALGLCKETIALIVGSTPESVRVRLSQLQAEKKEGEKPKELKEIDE